jgi:hypothetical protein
MFVFPCDWLATVHGAILSDPAPIRADKKKIKDALNTAQASGPLIFQGDLFSNLCIK